MRTLPIALGARRRRWRSRPPEHLGTFPKVCVEAARARQAPAPPSR